MSKTPEELNELKNECEALTNKLKELSEDEIELVTGGSDIKDWFDKIGEMTKKVVPVGSNPILGGNPDNIINPDDIVPILPFKEDKP